jgi:ABC-type transporter Mla MlaB component
MIPPALPASVYLYQTIMKWNLEQAVLNVVRVDAAGAALLAELLSASLTQAGFMCDEIHEGSALVCLSSDLAIMSEQM